MVISIREAHSPDIDELIGLDDIARRDPIRASFLRDAVERGNCLVADRAGCVLGYGILDYSFYGQGFIPLVYVRADSRRHGVGSNLIRGLEARCVTPKLFTSTNDSNKPMKALLSQLGFDRSGIIHNLDPGDPEIVYFKLRTTGTV
ncbi:MAG: GNAT family N-acetyltransferase [Spirochaetaceae bacterium]|nr:MAG: GNAT family N-acetyltransferase [Spirochaetaceae bacterium]